ncbi:unnamed protein product [Ixodes pacificus]
MGATAGRKNRTEAVATHRTRRTRPPVRGLISRGEGLGTEDKNASWDQLGKTNCRRLREESLTDTGRVGSAGFFFPRASLIGLRVQRSGRSIQCSSRLIQSLKY